ncbi:MAG TPA: hypothetical protein VHW60_19230 [Caulobacteraceae bacterium]|jgi:hypothetical protein|nr:hypothetical protein [Caulobacteraceae bacterium]
MTYRLRNLALGAASLAFAGATSALAQTNSATPATDQTPPAASPGKVPPPPAGKAEVVFFRPWAYPGALVSFTIHEGKTGVAKLGNNTYAVVTADPGDHTYTSQSEATDTLHLELDAGEVYYVRNTLGMGLMLYRPHLTPSDEATFDKSKSIKLSTEKPTDLSGH